MSRCSCRAVSSEKRSSVSRNLKGTGISLGHALGRLVALLVTAAGTIMIVELVQRFFSSDYKALASAGNWPPVTFLGREWLPFAVSTWLIPWRFRRWHRPSHHRQSP
ncbi:hypothetical protein VXQ18_09015 [Brucella abortus]|nr:hypothetical protein [Brucella abortus]